MATATRSASTAGPAPGTDYHRGLQQARRRRRDVIRRAERQRRAGHRRDHRPQMAPTAGLALAVATPAAQAMAQNLLTPRCCSPPTDPVEAEPSSPGCRRQRHRTRRRPDRRAARTAQGDRPDAETVGIVYASGEVSSRVQVDRATGPQAARPDHRDPDRHHVNDPTGRRALGGVDAIYVPTDSMVVPASPRSSRRAKQIP